MSLIDFAILYLSALAARAGGSTNAPEYQRQLDSAFLRGLRGGRREELLETMSFVDGELQGHAVNWEGSVPDYEERRCVAALNLRTLYRQSKERAEVLTPRGFAPRFYVSAHASRFGGTVFFVMDRAVEDRETGLDAWVGYAETEAEAEERARTLRAAASWSAGEVR